MKIDLPADSPVTLISYSMGQTRVTARGGAMVLDLDMSLTLRNFGARSVRDVMLLITAQEFTPGGKGSVARPSIDVPAGQNFTLPINLRLIRPVQQANGPGARAARWRAVRRSQFLRAQPAEFAARHDVLGSGSRSAIALTTNKSSRPKAKLACKKKY